MYVHCRAMHLQQKMYENCSERRPPPVVDHVENKIARMTSELCTLKSFAFRGVLILSYRPKTPKCFHEPNIWRLNATRYHGKVTSMRRQCVWSITLYGNVKYSSFDFNILFFFKFFCKQIFSRSRYTSCGRTNAAKIWFTPFRSWGGKRLNRCVKLFGLLPSVLFEIFSLFEHHNFVSSSDSVSSNWNGLVCSTLCVRF